MRCPFILVGLIVCHQALAGPLGSGFIGGNLRAAGFPDPLRQNPTNVVTLKSGSGGGSTGGGFGGFASSSAQITDSDADSTIALSGFASHFNPDGYTAAYTNQPLLLALTKPTRFAITDASRTNDGPLRMVTFAGISGTISETSPGVGTLSAGTYSIRYGVGGGRVNQFGPTVVSEWFSGYGAGSAYGSNLDWTLKLTPVLPTFSVGNFAPSSEYYVQGQSFTPAAFGNVWTPPNPTSTPQLVRLTTFTIAYNLANSTPFDALYIFDSPPTPANAATGAGSRATGTHIGGGIYAFTNTVLDFNTKYYAVLPGAASIYDGGGDPYPGGVDMFIRSDLNPVVIGEGYGTFDLGFEAAFEYVSGCPADINNDGLVDDSDFQLFAVAYDTLECMDPTMPAGCPSNLNADLFVDDADFSVFAIAYDTLICP
ncbi:MAG: hypothetical protein K2Y21_11820 [Phycisphaerales bacterium]|nr:hypothetical protein [Phycisphaerales bacterium]